MFVIIKHLKAILPLTTQRLKCLTAVRNSILKIGINQNLMF